MPSPNRTRVGRKLLAMAFGLALAIVIATLAGFSPFNDVSAHPASEDTNVRVSALKGGEGRMSVGAERHINRARGILLCALAMPSWQPLVTETKGP